MKVQQELDETKIVLVRALSFRVFDNKFSFCLFHFSTRQSSRSCNAARSSTTLSNAPTPLAHKARCSTRQRKRFVLQPPSQPPKLTRSPLLAKFMLRCHVISLLSFPFLAQPVPIFWCCRSSLPYGLRGRFCLYQPYGFYRY